MADYEAWCGKMEKKSYEDTIPAGWGVNGVLEGAHVDEAESMSERARAREGERRNEREIARDMERGRQREREGDDRTPFQQVGV